MPSLSGSFWWFVEAMDLKKENAWISSFCSQAEKILIEDGPSTVQLAPQTFLRRSASTVPYVTSCCGAANPKILGMNNSRFRTYLLHCRDARHGSVVEVAVIRGEVLNPSCHAERQAWKMRCHWFPHTCPDLVFRIPFWVGGLFPSQIFQVQRNP